MSTILTIGFNKKPLRRFAEMLQAAGVDALIDVRLNNTSQLAGYAKRDDLAYILELLGIAYERYVELAPTDQLLKDYRETKDFQVYEREFEKLIRERDMVAVGREILKRYSRPCLLCAEEASDECHRRLVAEAWAREIDDVDVEHLV